MAGAPVAIGSVFRRRAERSRSEGVPLGIGQQGRDPRFALQTVHLHAARRSAGRRSHAPAARWRAEVRAARWRTAGNGRSIDGRVGGAIDANRQRRDIAARRFPNAALHGLPYLDGDSVGGIERVAQLGAPIVSYLRIEIFAQRVGQEELRGEIDQCAGLDLEVVCVVRPRYQPG